ncbi:OmpA family protein [Enterovibrio nigricans]|uniref:OmpA family protein n=1 Tax=Enterovibrio nigricans DSM 22720 TaxID=1121868 RepID=A0A1T4V8J3_9GAMM|nr:OmpA family protein [Enterovibrio nigricans]PKF50226.1 hypothetical protein AT251_12985 [Enterovibrio nigricans]SKA61298.1 OmpA family protein [Enterovibrio nigricans DSM 22720]
MKKRLILVVASLLLTACSAPKPPSITGKYEEVNLVKPKPLSEDVVILKDIQHQLITMNALHVAQLNQESQPQPSQRFVIHYPFNQTAASTQQMKPALVAAKSACKVELHARTDGAIPTEGDKTVAKNRAVNLRNQLVRYGIEPTKIFINYAASTDYADNNWTTQGRANNRRVEINIYDTCMEE